jgi:UDP-N-acetylmuramoyl-tripeptide--D-alanyl-D-alanine ligase
VIDLSPERIREVTGAALLAGGPSRTRPDDMPKRAIVDSRDARPGDLFVGTQGDRVDGGEFAEQAAAAGAWGVLVRAEHGMRVAAMSGSRVRVLAVEDPLAALGRLARAWADRLWAEGSKTVGITGSTGKTSTKDILFALLTPVFGKAVHATPANYNTEIGLPLSVLGAEVGTGVLVLEMAMRGPGQIRELCDIAPPDVGVITNVGAVHLEALGTVEAVAETKAELIAALPPEGICIVPAYTEALRPHLRSEVRTLTFASWPDRSPDSLAGVERVAGAAADLRVIRSEPVEIEGRDGTRAEIAIGAEHVTLEFNFPHAHNLTNALAAIGAAHALEVPLDALAEGARRVSFSELRGEEIRLSREVAVINDCYNANPMSMRAALDHLADVAARRRASRSVAVLGEMAELGPDGPRFHRDVGEHAAAAGVGLIVAVGELGGAYLEGYGDAGEVRQAADAEEAAALLPDAIEPGDVVLVKGSRSVGLERVTDGLVRSDVEGKG